MNRYVFLLRIKDEQERDAVKYLDLETGKFECGHYFAGLRITGACFSGFESELKKKNIEDFETILTENEIKRLWAFDDKINQLGYGITKGDKRYQKGLHYNEEVEDIIEKLQSKENQVFFEKIQQEEKEILKNEYNLNDEEINEIWKNYGQDYRDRAIVSYIYDNFDEFAEETADSYCVAENETQRRYFNYEAWGNDLLVNDESYFELSNGQIVMYSY